MSDDKFNEPADSTAAAAEQASAEQTDTSSAVQRERDELLDRLLRKTAEFDNYRKRVDRDRQAMAESTAADLYRDLLPLVDDLERALKSDPGTEGAESYRRGVELIHRQLLEILRKRGVRPIEALGADFDPHFHQAIAHEPAEGRREGEVIEEFGRGYTLNDKLIRPSIVKVAKGQ
jgi:molecular chaperone GrpE